MTIQHKEETISSVVLEALSLVVDENLIIENKYVVVEFSMKMLLDNKTLSSSVVHVLNDDIIGKDDKINLLASYLKYAETTFSANYNLSEFNFHIVSLALNHIHQNNNNK